MRLLASRITAAALALAAIATTPVAAGPAATGLTIGPSVPPVITIVATGGASAGSTGWVFTLPIGRTMGMTSFRAGEGFDLTFSTSITSLPLPITVSVSNLVLDFATGIAAADAFNPPGPATVLPILSFAPGIANDDNPFLTPVSWALPGRIGMAAAARLRVGSFTQVPVPASFLLLAPFGLALAGVASVGRREPLRSAA